MQPVFENQTFDLHAEKNFELSSTGSEFSVEYKLLNNSADAIKGFFGTLLDTGLLACGHTDRDILIDGVPLKFNFRDPLIFPDACSLEIADKTTSSRIELVFKKKAAVLVSPIFGASSLAAPEALQGIRVFPFWKINLASQTEFELLMTAKISKR
jgi:archaellum component FlaF (FlaF/FlaG flagellin family)